MIWGPADKRLTGNGGKLNTSQAEPVAASSWAVGQFLSISCEAFRCRTRYVNLILQKTKPLLKPDLLVCTCRIVDGKDSRFRWTSVGALTLHMHESSSLSYVLSRVSELNKQQVKPRAAVKYIKVQ